MTEEPELPGIAPLRVKITNPVHIYLMGVAQGQMMLLDMLEKVAPNQRNTPGFALAEAKVAAEMYQNRAETVSRNLAAIAKSGIDISNHKSVRFDPNTGELLVGFYHPDEGL